MGGGAIPVSIEQRLQLLERRNEELLRIVDQMAHRDRSIGFPRQIWIAKTVKDGASYPPEGSDTFAIVFQDGEFTRAEGSPSSTFTNRSASTMEYAKSLAGNYYTEGTYVAVFEENRQYWIADSVSADGTDTHVKVSADEPTGTVKTGEYLEDQFYDHNVTEDFNTSSDILLSTDTKYTGTPPSHTDEHIRIYWETDTVACYTASTTEFFIHNGDEGDEPQWATVDQPDTSANSSSNRDLILDHEWVASGTCTKLRTFLDASAQTGAAIYDSSMIQLLGHHSDADWGYYQFGVTGAFASEDFPVRFDITSSPGAIDAQLHPPDLTRGWSPGAPQYLGKNASDQFTWLSSTSQTDTDYRVAINSDDLEDGVGNYLNDKFENLVYGSFDTTADLELYCQILYSGKSQTILFFIDASAIPNFASTSEPKYLTHNNGQFEWGDVTTEDYRFRVSSGAAGTWSDRAEGEAVYTQTSEDLPVSWDEYPTNNITLFLDASAIPSFGTVSDPKYLSHNGGQWEWRAGTSDTDTDYRFEINSSDAAPGRWVDKIANEDIYVTTEDLPVDWDEYPSDQATMFIDASAISQWGAVSGRKYLTHYSGHWEWAAEPEGTSSNTDYRVSINATDVSGTTGDYLSDKFSNQQAHDTLDLDIGWHIEGSGTSQTIEFFINADIIPGWSGGSFPKHLGHSGTQWQWYEPSEGGSDTDYRFEINSGDASPGRWVDKIANEDVYALTEDLPVDWDEYPSDQATMFIDASAIPEFYIVAGRKYLTHYAGRWEWAEEPEGTGTNTDYRVAININDVSGTTGDYLSDKFSNQQAHDTLDLDIGWHIEGSGTSQTIEFFINADIIPGWSGGSFPKHLGHSGAGWQWYEPPEAGGTDTDYRFKITVADASGGTWSDKVQFESIYQAVQDLPVSWDETPNDAATLFIDADAIYNYGNVSDPKYLTHNGGRFEWRAGTSGTDTDYRFSIDSGDASPGRWDTKVDNEGVYAQTSEDLIVSWDNFPASPDQVTLFIDATAIPNFYSVTEPKLLSHNNGQWEWTASTYSNTDYRVAININDRSSDNGDYLSDKFANQGTFSSPADLPLHWHIEGTGLSQQIEFFIDASSIPYLGAEPQYLVHNNGRFEWHDEPGNDTDYRLKIFESDTVEGTWSDKVYNQASYTQGPEDLLVSWDEYPNDKAAMFIDANAIAGWYTGSFPKHLGHSGSQWQWYEPDAGGGADTDYRFAISTGTAGTWSQRIERHTSSFDWSEDLQVSWAEVSGNAYLYIDARTPTNFDATDEPKFLTHNGGHWEWADQPCYVRMNAAMTTCKYLEELIETVTRDSSQSHDLLIDWEITGAANTQQIQHFIDASAISNWTETKEQALGNTSGGSWYWWDIESANVLTDIRFAYDAGTGKYWIQTKSKTCKVIGPTFDSGWINKIEHTEC